MDSLIEYLYNVFSIFIFCMAISVMIIIDRNLNQLIITFRTNLKQENTVYEQRYEEANEKSVVSYYKLIGVLMEDLECHIKINDLYLDLDEYNYLTFDYYQIPKTDYKQIDIHDLNGIVIQSEYVSILK